MCDDHPAGPLGRRRFLQAALATSAFLLGGEAITPTASGYGESSESDGMGEDPAGNEVGAAGVGDAASQSASTLPRILVAAPALVTRAEWRADETQRTSKRAFAPLQKLIIHHSAAPASGDGAALVRGVYDWHVRGRRWSDIAYNFIIDRKGNVFEGRWARDYPSGAVHDGEDGSGNVVVGAHAKGFNTGTVGVCLLGNFDDTVPSDAALESLVHLIAWKAGPRGLDPTGSGTFVNYAGRASTLPNITPHKIIGIDTHCPGTRFLPMIDDVRRAVLQRLGAAGSTTSSSDGSTAATGGAVTQLGYRIARSDGSVETFGSLPRPGKERADDINRAGAVAIAPGREPGGYWLMGADGTVFAAGSGTRFKGSLRQLGVSDRPVAIVGAGDPEAYWVLSTPGRVYAFGRATSYGSPAEAGRAVTASGLAATPTFKGYWVLAKDGSVYAYGDAPGLGGLPERGIRGEAVSIAGTPSGKGYWLLGRNGGILAFGDAAFHGSVTSAGIAWSGLGVAIVPTADGGGYHVLASDGGVFAFGNARFLGSRPDVNSRAVGLAVVRG